MFNPNPKKQAIWHELYTFYISYRGIYNVIRNTVPEAGSWGS